MIFSDKYPTSESPGVSSSRPDDRISRIEDEIQLISKIDDVDDKSEGRGGSSNIVLDFDIVATKKKRS